MAKFYLTPECAPGAPRESGMYKVGDIVDFENLKPLSLCFAPVDQEAYDIMVKKFGKEKVEKKYPTGPMEAPEPKKVDGLGKKKSLRQLNQLTPAFTSDEEPSEENTKPTTKRASDDE